MMENRRRFVNRSNRSYRRNNNFPGTVQGPSNHRDREGDRDRMGPRIPRQDVRNVYWKKDQSKFDRRNRMAEMEDDSEVWFKIVIPRAAKCGKQYLLEKLQQHSGIPFMALNYHNESNSAVFFILGGDQMAAIRACSRRIYDQDGYALAISVQPSQVPVPQLNKKVEEAIVDTLKRRYNYQVKTLFLDSFSQDPGLMGADLYIPLSRMTIFNFVVDIIRKEYSEIVGLSLSDNKLTSIQALVHLTSICKNLKALNLSKNKIKSVNDLDPIKNIELVELVIEGNPLSNPAAFSEAEKGKLVSSLRTRFPKLAKLDGVDLPPAIGFDVGDSDDLPPSYGHYIPNEVKSFVGEFLDQYFKIYDSEDRRPMLAAYHDQAAFSYSVGRTDNSKHTFVSSMIAGSRNLTKIREDGENKTKLLHIGGQAIVDALCELPRTKHAPSLMRIDVPFYVSSFFTIVVNGVFKEFTKKQVHTRAFGRTFLIVPQGQGFVIINDILVITNGTVEQVQKYNRSLENDSISNCIKEDRFDCFLDSLSLGEGNILDQGFNPVPQSQPPQQLVSQAVQNQQPFIDPNNKDVLIQQFSSMTNMNRQFSTQCLEENVYDIQKSFEVFKQLNEQGAIPPEAFVQ